MNAFEEGMELLEKTFGNGRDNLIALATIAMEPGEEGRPCPAVRTVDAYYENGVFYVVTNSGSGKMLQIAKNSEIAVAGYQEMFTADGEGVNLGWVLEPENAGIRSKLRKTFAAWYDMANNERDKNCCILALRLKKCVLNINHWEKLYNIDLVKKTGAVSAGGN